MSSSPQSCTSTPVTSYTVDSASFSFACDISGADIMAEAFTASTDSDLIMFDFQVTNAPSDYILQLTASGAPINSSDDLGLFTCPPAAPPQCGGLPMGVAADSITYGSLTGDNIATFPVTGATPSNSFVFFVALDDPQVCEPGTPCPTGPGNACDPSVDTCVRTSANVTATFLPTTATPEPRLLPILGLGLLALVIVRWRRAAHTRTAAKSPLSR
jgi:hypothetical protein